MKKKQFMKKNMEKVEKAYNSKNKQTEKRMRKKNYLEWLKTLHRKCQSKL